MSPQRRSRSTWKGMAAVALGFAATAIPLHLLLRRELRQTPESVRGQGWPIQLIQILFQRYVDPWIDVEGIGNLPEGSWLIACNHAYKSGVDGFVLGHLLATRADRVPRILMTGESRQWMVRVERWVLHHYGIALLVPDLPAAHGTHARGGLTDSIAAFLRESNRRAVIIFPAGRATADPAVQLKEWSTGVAVAARKSGCPIVPVAFGGLRQDWSPETVLLNALQAEGAQPPFRIHVRIGKPVQPGEDAHATLDEVRAAVGALMHELPGYRPAPGEADPAFGKITLRDGRTLAYMDRGPRTGTPVFYFHSFQGSRLERVAGIDAILEKLQIRMISPDRPGIGLSTPLAGRTLSGWVGDVRQLAERTLNPGQTFSILGFSAGGTYALACAHLPGLRAMSLVGGLGLPHVISSWRHLSPAARNILLSAKLANFHSDIFLRLEKKHRDLIFDHWETDFEDVKKALSPDDQRILSSPEVEQLFRENRRESYAQGPGYLLQEVQALYSDPQVNLTHPGGCIVEIVHGAEDTIVPIAVARDLHARIRDSRLTELPGRGHYFIYEETAVESVLTGLLRAHNV